MMESTIRPRQNDRWAWPRRALHKLYRLVYESPRRRRIASRILALPPAPPVPASLDFTVHMLVCRRDVEMAICTAKAANLACEQPLPWVFHDDGSLREEEANTFRTHLPGCRVVLRDEADRRAARMLPDYPHILTYRRHQVMALKLVDVRLWSTGDRLAYIDSDILFFRKPAFFLDALRGERPKNYFNRDMADAYVRPAGEIERDVGIRPCSRLNAGLWVMHATDIDFDAIETWLQHAAFREHLYAYTLDQTFISMLASRSHHGVEHLPASYDVAFDKDVRSSVNKHYVGRIRHGYELEGLRYLLREGRFERRWRQLVNGRSLATHAGAQ